MQLQHGCLASMPHQTDVHSLRHATVINCKLPAFAAKSYCWRMCTPKAPDILAAQISDHHGRRNCRLSAVWHIDGHIPSHLARRHAGCPADIHQEVSCHCDETAACLHACALFGVAAADLHVQLSGQKLDEQPTILLPSDATLQCWCHEMFLLSSVARAPSCTVRTDRVSNLRTALPTSLTSTTSSTASGEREHLRCLICKLRRCQCACNIRRRVCCLVEPMCALVALLQAARGGGGAAAARAAAAQAAAVCARLPRGPLLMAPPACGEPSMGWMCGFQLPRMASDL
jgi:hypothetical protein